MVDTLDGRLGEQTPAIHATNAEIMRKSRGPAVPSNALNTGKMRNRRSLHGYSSADCQLFEQLRLLLNASCQAQTLILTGVTDPPRVTACSTAISSHGVVADTNDTHRSTTASRSIVEASMASSFHCPSSSSRLEAAGAHFRPSRLFQLSFP